MVKKKNVMVNKNILLTGFILLCAACVKNENPAPGPGPEIDPENVFTFSTTQTAKLEVNYQYPYKLRSFIRAYTQNPLEQDEYGNFLLKDGIEPFAEGYTDPNGKISLPVEVPAAVSRIYIYSPSLGAPDLTVYDVNGNPVQTQTAAEKVSAGTKSSSPYYKNWPKQSLRLLNPGEWNYDAAGKPSYLLAQGMDLTQKTLESIDATIPKGEQLDLLYSQSSAIHISESAHMTLYNIFNKTSRSNALAYYIYPGDENDIPRQAEINENLILVYPNLSGDVLKAGDGVQLKYFDGTAWSEVFPANTNIGFVLLIDAWENGQLKTNNIHVMYSQKTYNRYGIGNSTMADRPQMAAFKSGQDLILSFEDQPWSDSPYFT